MSEDRTPRVRRRDDPRLGAAPGPRERRRDPGLPPFAILISFLIGAVIVLATGNNPLTAYAALVRGGRLPYRHRPDAARRDAPGLHGPRRGRGLPRRPVQHRGRGTALHRRYNRGLARGVLGFLGPFSVVLVLGACVLTGFLWGAIPGFLKARFGAHEVITTIMLNYIGINLAYYFALQPLRTKGLVPGTDTIDIAARIPFIGLGLGRANYGFFIALLAAVVAYLLLWRTRGVPDPGRRPLPGAASYAGMGIGTNVVLALAIGGAFAAVGGGVEVLGVYGKMTVPFVTNLGYNGIGVALLGRNHPIGVVLGALLFGGSTLAPGDAVHRRRAAAASQRAARRDPAARHGHEARRVRARQARPRPRRHPPR